MVLIVKADTVIIVKYKLKVYKDQQKEKYAQQLSYHK